MTKIKRLPLLVATAFTLLAMNSFADDLQVKPLQTQVESQLKPQIKLGAQPTSGLKDAKQANDGGIIRTPFNHKVTANGMYFHGEQPAGVADPLLVVKEKSPTQPVIKKQKKCLAPQVQDGNGGCKQPDPAVANAPAQPVGVGNPPTGLGGANAQCLPPSLMIAGVCVIKR